MTDFSKYTIKTSATVIDALKRLDKSPLLLTIFVEDENDVIVGTITDGDIRRGLINGLSLTDDLKDFMYPDFHFLKENEDNFDKFRKFRELKLKAIPLLSENGKLIKIFNFDTIKSILPIDSVIMAGGLGSRLLPLTKETPKPLLKIGGKEIIAHNIDRLHQFGITNQHITINYLAEKIETFCTDYNSEINFNLVKEESYLGTAGSLSLIDHFQNDTILLMNSDLLTNIDFEDFYLSFKSSNADLMVASVPYDVNLPYAILEAENRKVSSFKEKPNFTYYASAGIYLIKKEILDNIPKNTFFNATDLMDQVIHSGMNLIHYPIRGYWLDIGNHKDFEKAQKDYGHINWD